MVFGQLVFQRLDQARRGDRTDDVGYTNRLECRRRQRLRGEARPEAVAVAGDRGEARDAFAADERVDLSPLNIGGAVGAAAETRVARARPGLRESRWQSLRIHTEVERSGGVAPDLPGRCRGF